MIGGCYNNDTFQNLFLRRLGYFTNIKISNQVLKNYFSPPTVIIRRGIFERVELFNEKLRYFEEGYFFNNIVYLGNSFFLSENLAEPIIFTIRTTNRHYSNRKRL